MVRTQIYLTEKQQRGLERLAAATGRRKSDLIREALDGYLADHQPKDWKDALEAVRGMWADRDDLDDFVRELRAGWEKRLERLYGR
ncbi:MAG TPA: ribbon-helix-helix protein, CopG family [Geminicoccaceae bacterium]|nr:ribbon-helix-helix protein, CopG family [Geminicoccaceae bacterium]